MKKMLRNVAASQSRIFAALILAGCVSGCGAREAPVEQENSTEKDIVLQESGAGEDDAELKGSADKNGEVQESGTAKDTAKSEGNTEDDSAWQDTEPDGTDLDEEMAFYGCGPVSEDLSMLPAMENRVYAEWEGRIYYRQYSDEDLEDGALWGIFAGIPDTVKELMCMEPDGSVTQVGVDYGEDELYIAGGRIYSQKGSEKDGFIVYSCALDGSDVRKYESFMILDVRGDRIVCAVKGNGLAWIDGQDGEEHILISENDLYHGTEYLEATEEEVFFYRLAENGSQMRVPYDLTLCSVDYQGKVKELATVTEQEYVDCLTDELMQYPLYIPCFQIWEDELYFSVGSANGNAYMYSGGMIYRVKKDGSGLSRLVDHAPGRTFYLYDDGANRVLFCKLPGQRTGRWNDGMQQIVLQGEAVDDIALRDADQTYFDRPHGYVTADGADAVLFYPDTSGVCYVLLTSEESEELGIRTHVDGNIVQQITDIEYLSGKLFFTVTDLTYSEEYSVGWRDGYERGRSVCYCKDMESGKISALYEY
ncbi:MAG: DUF5050 domain-containing protein [Lachnospiraceae bacterium]|nr:DUF5050 domain-containing protein [Lachnospiraceae bacterium]